MIGARLGSVWNGRELPKASAPGLPAVTPYARPNTSVTPPAAVRMAAAAGETGVLPLVVPLAKKYFPALESEAVVSLV